MSSAIALDDVLCWGSTGAIEDILSRAAALSLAQFGADHPTTILLIEEDRTFWGGKVVVFPTSMSALGSLAQVLVAARDEARQSGEFTDVGLAWLDGSLADFCNRVRQAAIDASL
jgi:hypothetical protein